MDGPDVHRIFVGANGVAYGLGHICVIEARPSLRWCRPRTVSEHAQWHYVADCRGTRTPMPAYSVSTDIMPLWIGTGLIRKPVARRGQCPHPVCQGCSKARWERSTQPHWYLVPSLLAVRRHCLPVPSDAGVFNQPHHVGAP